MDEQELAGAITREEGELVAFSRAILQEMWMVSTSATVPKAKQFCALRGFECKYDQGTDLVYFRLRS